MTVVTENWVACAQAGLGGLVAYAGLALKCWGKVDSAGANNSEQFQ